MKYSSKVAALCISAAFATGFAFADGDIPTVTEASMQQGPGNRIVTIKYKLDSYPAVVTLDVKTNDTVSIGGEHIWNAEGAVWRKVTSADADGSGWCTITWDPTQSWKDGNGNGFKAQDVKAEVTAWPLDNTPDYMVVDISAAAQQNTQKYYPAVDFLPGSELGQIGSVTNNPAYKTSMLLMRKIMAKNVTWTMGSTALETQRTAANESTHQVALTNNYYIGVFPITQEQWGLVKTDNATPSWFNNATVRAMRPVEKVSYNAIRMTASGDSAASGAKEWPEAPYEGSFLDLLYRKTGIRFDLPSEAQWEFAARAGNGDTKWGNGSGISNNKTTDGNLDSLGRYKYNGGYAADGESVPSQSCGAENGTAIVGSYAPNNWGLYDMFGNVFEWCLDWYNPDVGSLNGAVNTLATTAWRVNRGGSFKSDAERCRPAYRNYHLPEQIFDNYGFRVACQAGLQ